MGKDEILPEGPGVVCLLYGFIEIVCQIFLYEIGDLNTPNLLNLILDLRLHFLGILVSLARDVVTT